MPAARVAGLLGAREANHAFFQDLRDCAAAAEETLMRRDLRHRFCWVLLGNAMSVNKLHDSVKLNSLFPTVLSGSVLYLVIP